ncbi:MAG: DUF368 domain-containing protein [Anaerovoracaceae bacterium]|jgi:putative membrane protein
MITTAINGMCMAIADSVPGVSGSTAAFIMGFYDKLIASISDLFHGRGKIRKTAFRYLCRLGAGWIIGMGCCVIVLSGLFQKNIYFMSSLFIGLTAASIPFIIKEEKESLNGHLKNIPFAVIGAAVVIGITMLRSGAGGAVNLTSTQPVDLLYLVLVGMVAISAMILPGISGSTVLLIAGAYLPVIYALGQVMKFDLTSLPGLAAVAIGILAGIILVIRLVRAALTNYRSQMIYLILGLMCGSFYAISMGPTTLADPVPALSLQTFSILGCAAGVGILLGLEKMRNTLNNKDNDLTHTEA